jgi:putative ABC transport system permease protein
MSPATLLRVVLKALAANPLRTGLTMLGMVIGVGALVVMTAVGAGAQARVEQEIQSLGSNLLLLRSGSARQTGARLGAGSSRRLSEDDALAVNRELPNVLAAPALRASAQIVWGNRNWATGIGGVTPEYFDVREWPAAAGRLFDSEETVAGARVSVIGKTVARQLFGDADPVGQMMRIQRVPFTVVGVLEARGQSLLGFDQDDVVLLPITTARSRLIGRPRTYARAVDVIWVRVGDQADAGAAAHEVRALIRQRHRLSGPADDDFSLQNLAEVVQRQEETSQTLSLLLAAVAAVSLVVGGIGIMNVMLVSVTERTREIGLRMVVGARTRDILVQFLSEAVILAMVGGLTGLALGVGTALALAALLAWPVLISVPAATAAMACAMLVGLLSGGYPAYKAARLNPAEAVRFE